MLFGQLSFLLAFWVFKRELKKEIKKMKKDPTPKAAKSVGGDLRWAAIFGISGVVLLIVGGEVLTIIGSLALLVGLIFFIKWIIYQ